MDETETVNETEGAAVLPAIETAEEAVAVLEPVDPAEERNRAIQTKRDELKAVEAEIAKLQQDDIDQSRREYEGYRGANARDHGVTVNGGFDWPAQCRRRAINLKECQRASLRDEVAVLEREAQLAAAKLLEPIDPELQPLIDEIAALEARDVELTAQEHPVRQLPGGGHEINCGFDPAQQGRLEIILDKKRALQVLREQRRRR